MKEILLRFLIGGAVVSAFALLGDLFKPKSFAGLFGAAPSVALATLALSVAFDGRDNAAQQSTSMMASSIALFCYSSCVSWIMMHRPHRTIWVTILVLPVSLDAAGTAMGSVGLFVFGLLVAELVRYHRPRIVIAAATVTWMAVSVLIWHVRKRL